MLQKQRVKEIQEEIRFLTLEVESILLSSGNWSKLERLAAWTNIRRIEKLEKELMELDKK